MGTHQISLIAFIVLFCLPSSIIGEGRILKCSFDQVKFLFTHNLPIRYGYRSITKAKTYYISANGLDSNNGLSTTSSFKTIQKAANLTNPGDTVLIMNGVYTEVVIDRSGTASKWITYRAYPGHHPKIQLPKDKWNGILIHNGASYIEVKGLEIVGNRANITLDYAINQKTNTSNPLTSGSCISIEGRADKSSGHPHHIRILNNKVHDCAGGGMGAIEADYVTIEGNEVFNNAWYSPYACSGISLGHNWSFDNKTGYKMFIRKNKTYNNRQYIPWVQTGTITDGNGIIIDDTRNAHNSKLGAYTGRTLVENNITYNNGGSGIHTFSSDRVDIFHNTAYLNNQSPEIQGGQIFAMESSDVKILSNILYAPSDKYINSNIHNTNVTYDRNIYANSTLIEVKGPNDILADPKFVNPSISDFRLQKNSPAIGKGFTWNRNRLKSDRNK
jgi:hypothetical protein